jgi:hypothetical protein
MPSSGMWRSVDLVLADVSEERSSETAGDTIATRGHVPEDGILHSHRRENLKSYIVFLYGETTHRHLRRLETP